jgi:hypothetical protein
LGSIALPSSSGVGSAFRARDGRAGAMVVARAGATLIVRAVVTSVLVCARATTRDGATAVVTARDDLVVGTVVVSTVVRAGAAPVTALVGAVVTMTVVCAGAAERGRAGVGALVRDGVHPRVEIPALAGSTSPVVVDGTSTVSTRVAARRDGTLTTSVVALEARDGTVTTSVCAPDAREGTRTGTRTGSTPVVRDGSISRPGAVSVTAAPWG